MNVGWHSHRPVAMLPDVSNDTLPVSLRRGRYQVLGLLGAGSQGDTLEALDKLNGRLVAVKRFRIKGARCWKDIELAEREARVLARLRHPALPRYLEHFEEDAALYLVMDKIEGETLARQLGVGRRFDQHDVVRLLHAAGDLLDYLHEQAPPVIHRDLKPGNIVVRSDGSFVFVDFGCVRDTLRPEGGSTVVGTFGYMAPEQFQGRALPATDIYAIGATALTLLAGTEPEKLPHKGLAIDVRQALRGSAPPALIRVLEQTLVPDPDARAQRLTPLLSALPTTRSRASTHSTPPRRRVSEPHDAPSTHSSTTSGPASSTQDSGSSPPPRRRRVRRRTRVTSNEPSAHSNHGDRPSTSGTPTSDPSADSVPLALVVLALSLVRVAVWALFQVVAPLLLTLLSLVLGPGLARASRESERLGSRIDNQLRRIRHRVERDSSDAGPARRVRVEQGGYRVHVDPFSRDENSFDEEVRRSPHQKRSRTRAQRSTDRDSAR